MNSVVEKTQPAEPQTAAEKTHPAANDTGANTKPAPERHPNRPWLVAPWKPGQSGNPSGRPKRDMAAEIAQAVFEKNPTKVYDAVANALIKGNPKMFTALSERAYGKMTQTIELTGLESLVDRLAKARERALGIDNKCQLVATEAIEAGAVVENKGDAVLVDTLPVIRSLPPAPSEQRAPDSQSIGTCDEEAPSSQVVEKEAPGQ